MNAYQAQRIRFGILAARHCFERDLMTADHVEYLEGCELVGWRVGDAGTVEAFDKECEKIQDRARHAYR